MAGPEHFCRFALLQLKFRLYRLMWGCALEHGQKRRSIPGGFVFPLQSSLITDLGWPRGSSRWEFKFAIAMGRKRRSKLWVITT